MSAAAFNLPDIFVNSEQIAKDLVCIHFLNPREHVKYCPHFNQHPPPSGRRYIHFKHFLESFHSITAQVARYCKQQIHYTKQEC